MSVLGSATPGSGTDPTLDGNGVAVPSACTNCGAAPGQPCLHDAGCVDADRAPLRVVCAWCSLVMREGEEPASHSICESCLKVVEEPPAAGSVAVRVARATWERNVSTQLQLGGETA